MKQFRLQFYCVIVLGFIAFFPGVVQHLLILCTKSRYQFSPILICCIGWLCVERNLKLSDLFSVKTNLPNIAIVSIGLGILFFSTLINTPNVAMFGFMIFSASAVRAIHRAQRKNLWGPWALGWLLVQFPGFVERSITQNLQLLSSTLSSRLLDWLKLNHFMSGNVLQLSNKSLFVDEACSGIISLFSIIAAGGIYIVWKQYSIVRGMFLLLVGVGCTVMLNVGRICLIAIADQWFNVNLIHGVPHTVLGVFLFCGTLAIFYSVDNCFGRLVSPIPTTKKIQRRNIFEKYWNNLFLKQSANLTRNDGQSLTYAAPINWSLSSLAFLLLLFWIFRFILLTDLLHSNEKLIRLANSVDSTMMEDSGHSFEFSEIRRNRTSIFGAYSRSFSVNYDGFPTPLHLAIDYPFDGQWHELTNCYESTGWTILRRTVLYDHSGIEDPVVEAEFTNLQGDYGYLVFSFFDSQGESVFTPERPNLFRWAIFDMTRRMKSGFVDKCFQIQLWHRADIPATVEQRQLLKQEFFKFRSRSRKKMFANK